MSSKVTILCADAAEEARLEPLLHALSRAAKGCRFAVPTADPSRLLAELGDRDQVWPIGRGMVATARSIAESDLVVLLGGPSASLLSLARAALAVSAARRNALPVVALGADAGEPRSAGGRLLWSGIRRKLRELHRAHDEPLGRRAAEIARRYLTPGREPRSAGD